MHQNSDVAKEIPRGPESRICQYCIKLHIDK